MAVLQGEFWTTARKNVVAVRLPVAYGLAVATMSDQTALLVEFCHFTIAPVWPASVRVVPVPLHTALAVGVAVPPTETGVTVIVNCGAFAVAGAAQPALDVN